MSYDIGDRRKLVCELKNEGGELSDPDVLTFQIRSPDGTTTYTWGTDAELVRDSVGVFHVYWDCTVAGSHYWRFVASGSVAAAEESGFRVRRTSFDPIT